ncbi:MAG: twitching motility protein PilT [Lachnospiraceae bacterium]|nr:twitching motility protein PilT [Lachnospiraceae bacterium]
MVQIIAGENGKGKTPYLLEKANTAVKSCEGTIVYLDKNSKHMHDLDIKIRLINVKEFPVGNVDGFIGFVAGIISQDHDLEYMFLDSFIKIAHLEDADIAPVIEELEKLGSKHGVTFVLSISKAESDLPENARKNIVVSL